MSGRPILFSAPMVRALLDGTKTQTRRVLNPQPINEAISIRKVATTKDCGAPVFNFYNAEGKPIYAIPCKHGRLGEFIPRFAIGDRLWVREGWACHWAVDDEAPSVIDPHLWSVRYLADNTVRPAARDGKAASVEQMKRGRPSIHMPRWASRLTLTVTDVRVQRLKDISEDDARAEGCRAIGAEDCPDEDMRSYIWAFSDLWDSINGPDAWCANPWVVAVSFTVHQCNIDQLHQQTEAA